MQITPFHQRNHNYSYLVPLSAFLRESVKREF
jgi:hypothetical protein